MPGDTVGSSSAPSRRPDEPTVAHRLFERPFSFGFFQAVRLLRRIRPEVKKTGVEWPPEGESVRYKSRPGLAFPASEVHALDPPGGGGDAPPEMTVSFLGLTGPMGVLPYPYTEHASARLRAGDSAFPSFLDIFHHRLVDLFYRIWEKHRPYVAHERGELDKRGDPDIQTKIARELIGLGDRSLRDRHALPDAVPLAYAPFFARRQRPAIALEAMLSDYFGVPVEVRPFQGHWIELDPADRSIVGTSGAFNALGETFVLGSRVWDEQGKFRVRLGPLTFAQFRSFLTDGPAFRPLVELTRLYADGELVFDVQLVLKKDHVPPCTLSADGAQLGRHAWLTTKGFDHDVDDVVLPGKLLGNG